MCGELREQVAHNLHDLYMDTVRFGDRPWNIPGVLIQDGAKPTATQAACPSLVLWWVRLCHSHWHECPQPAQLLRPQHHCDVPVVSAPAHGETRITMEARQLYMYVQHREKCVNDRAENRVVRRGKVRIIGVTQR